MGKVMDLKSESENILLHFQKKYVQMLLYMEKNMVSSGCYLLH